MFFYVYIRLCKLPYTGFHDLKERYHGIRMAWYLQQTKLPLNWPLLRFSINTSLEIRKVSKNWLRQSVYERHLI
jgi:hypothetical protein